MFKKWILFSVYILALVACAESSKESFGGAALFEDDLFAIVGGKEAAEGSPLVNRVFSVVSNVPGSLYWKDGVATYGSDRYQCSGVALSKRVILTAAHCWDNTQGAVHSVYIINSAGETIEYPVMGKKIHEGFQLGSFEYDIALFQLMTDLPDNVELAQLPKFKGQIKPKYVNGAGFGKSIGTLSSDKGTGTLRIATLKVLDYDKRSTSFLTDQSEGKGVCQGDSGGPAYAYQDGKAYVVGVVSRTVGTDPRSNIHRDACNLYGIFTKVDNNINWIRKHLEILNTGYLPEENIIEKFIKKF